MVAQLAGESVECRIQGRHPAIARVAVPAARVGLPELDADTLQANPLVVNDPHVDEDRLAHRSGFATVREPEIVASGRNAICGIEGAENHLGSLAGVRCGDFLIHGRTRQWEVAHVVHAFSLGDPSPIAERLVSMPAMSTTHTPDMLRGVPLEALRGFEVAARVLNYTRAAAELHVTQSAVSREIATLEARVGVRLFERVNGALRLTPPGLMLQREVQLALSALRRALERAASSADRRTLVVSVSRPLGAEWLSRILPKFLNVNPGIDIRLVMQARSSVTTDWVGIEEPVEPDVNVALRLLPIIAGGGRLQLLLPEFVYPCCAPEVALHAGRAIKDTPDLSRHRLLEYDDGMPGLELLDASWSNWFVAAGTAPVVPQQWVRIPDWSAIIRLARAGAGVFLGRSPLVHSYLREGLLVRPTKLSVASSRGYFLSRRNSGQSDVDTDLFIDWLVQEAASEQDIPQRDQPRGAGSG